MQYILQLFHFFDRYQLIYFSVLFVKKSMFKFQQLQPILQN